MKKLEITKEEYEKAKSYKKTNTNKNIDRKLRVIILRYEGCTNEEICFATNYTSRSISNIINQFKAYGIEEFVILISS